MTLAQILPPDKAQHAIAGALAYLAGAALCAVLKESPVIGGLMASLAAGLAKELADKVANIRAGAQVREVSGADLLATVGGGVAMWCAAMIGGA